MKQYWSFFRKNARLVSFGGLQTFTSSFGQTFFISLFLPLFIDHFQLTKSSFGTLYSLATLGSAFTLPYFGKWIDSMDIRYYSLLVSCGLITAILVTALSWHFLILFGGLYMLRLFGQGLSSHTGQTAMARYFQDFRGKALSISSLGYPLGEAVLPLTVTSLIGYIGWRMSLISFALFIAIVLIPASLWLLNTARSNLSIESAQAHLVETNGDQEPESGWSRRDVIRDSRFIFMIPAVLLPPFLITGFFLYQIPLAESKGWTSELMASAFTAFALSRVIFSLLTGPAIDRFSASRLFPLYILPLGLGLFILFQFTGGWAAFVYMLFAGVTMGMSINIKSALWAELYGIRNLGTIKSLFSSLMVFSTATSPILFGWLLDHGISFRYITIISLLLILVGFIMAFRIFPSFKISLPGITNK